MANFIILGVVDHIVMPYKLPIATNRDVITRDNITGMILSLVIIFCQNNNRRWLCDRRLIAAFCLSVILSHKHINGRRPHMTSMGKWVTL